MTKLARIRARNLRIGNYWSICGSVFCFLSSQPIILAVRMMTLKTRMIIIIILAPGKGLIDMPRGRHRDLNCPRNDRAPPQPTRFNQRGEQTRRAFKDNRFAKSPDSLYVRRIYATHSNTRTDWKSTLLLVARLPRSARCSFLDI